MRILIIEDYAPILNSVMERLKEESYVVDGTATGDEGLWYAQNHDYDVIVLDIMLPKMDGISILKELRKEKVNTPIIIISAKDSVESRVEGLEAGADDYLIKPFSLDELLARVRVQIRKHYKQESAMFQMAGLEIDFTSRRVTLENEELMLTNREYGILEYLAHRSGEVVSRQDIWNHVYHEYGDLQSNAVDVYVGYLRKKLTSTGHPNIIQTRRGQGFYLEAPTTSAE